MFDGIQASQATKVGLLVVFVVTLVLIFISQSNKPEQLDQPSAELLTSDRMIRTGGLGAIKEKDETVVEVVNQIKPLLEEKTGKKYSSLEVVNYKTQLVAGTNYFVKVEAKEAVTGKESIMHLRIYKDLTKKLELTAFQDDKTRDEELKHFEP